MLSSCIWATLRHHETARQLAPGRTYDARAPSDGNTGYTDRMAKVMVSLPDDLLRAVDVEAGRRGTTRSGFLRELAEETLQRRSVRRAERMAEIGALDGPLVGHGGGVAELVKTTRPEH